MRRALFALALASCCSSSSSEGRELAELRGRVGRACNHVASAIAVTAHDGDRHELRMLLSYYSLTIALCTEREPSMEATELNAMRIVEEIRRRWP